MPQRQPFEVVVNVYLIQFIRQSAEEAAKAVASPRNLLLYTLSTIGDRKL